MSGLVAQANYGSGVMVGFWVYKWYLNPKDLTFALRFGMKSYINTLSCNLSNEAYVSIFLIEISEIEEDRRTRTADWQSSAFQKSNATYSTILI